MRLTPLTPEKARFAAWFLAADWPAEEVADLFDIDVAELTSDTVDLSATT